MDTRNIDLINIFLVVASLMIAMKLPFELFMFSYAILGPLHYLTEINWLSTKNYFIKQDRRWMLFFLVITAIGSIYPTLTLIDLGLSESLNRAITLLDGQFNTLLLTGFLFAISLLFVQEAKQLFIALGLILVVSFYATNYLSASFAMMVAFLPTIIHVYLFTLLFVLYGALKSKSGLGFLLGGVILSIPFIIAFVPFDSLDYKPSEGTVQVYLHSGFPQLGAKVASLFGALPQGKFNIFSEIALRVQVFIAFAYTYHYLNWFSKTSIIGWTKNLSTPKVILIIGIWLLSIWIYQHDYKTGIQALFFLSVLHVTMEFPLNAVTIRELLSWKNYRGG